MLKLYAKVVKVISEYRIQWQQRSTPKTNILKGKNSSEVCVREQYFKGYFLTIPRETDGIQVSSESHVFEH